MKGGFSTGLWLRVAPGLEGLAAEELESHGVRGQIEPGGVVFREQDLDIVLLHSRIGTAVTRRLGVVRVEQLPDALHALPWKRFVRRGQRLDVRLVGIKVRGLDKKCAAVIARRANPRPSRGARTPAAEVVIARRDHRAEVAIVAGEDLWKRGWRKRPGRAPLRESLAAALLRAAGWTPDEWLVDPMCGSGTFVVEAAHRQLGRAPGAYRSFAAQWWPDFQEAAFDRAVKRARASKSGPVRAMGCDRDGRQVFAARDNAKNARVDRHVRIDECAFEDLEPPADSGLLVMNPPYGRRVGASEGTYRFIGGQLRRWEGWRYGVLLPDPSLTRCLPGRPEIAVGTRNGGQRVWFAVGECG